MTTATKTKRTRKPQTRSCKIVLPLLKDEPSVGILSITQGKETAEYAIWRLTCDDAQERGFRMLKLGNKDGESYDVLLTSDGPQCECLGHLRHGHCKHGSCLSKLTELGRI